MEKNIEVTISMKGNAAVLGIRGDVTATTGVSLEEACNGNGVADGPKLVLSFDKSCYINSGGLAFLINIATQGRKKGQKIYVTGLSDHFQKIFHMVGLTRCMELVASEELALKG